MPRGGDGRDIRHDPDAEGVDPFGDAGVDDDHAGEEDPGDIDADLDEEDDMPPDGVIYGPLQGLVFFRPASGKKGVSYEEAAEEALSFGWIDSIIKRIDDDRHVRKFTPRTDTARWSAVNIARLRKMIEQGIMTEAGLGRIDRDLLDGTGRPPKRPSDGNPESAAELLRSLEAHPAAKRNFLALPPSSRKLHVGSGR